MRYFTQAGIIEMLTEKLLVLKKLIDGVKCDNTLCSVCVFATETVAGVRYCAAPFIDYELASRGVTL